MSRVIRFEIHATEPQVLIEFYSEVLGWTFENVGPFWTIRTGSHDAPGIDGGLVQRPCSAPDPSPALNAFLCTVEVGSVDETLGRAVERGARIALPKMGIPTLGWLAYITDPDHNVLGLLQPDERAR